MSTIAQETQERAHALLAASGAHKWINCTPSARLEDTLPDSESDHAREGTLAHSVGELKLRKHFFPMKPSDFKAQLKQLQENPLYQDEMLTHTNTYLNYIAKIVHGFNSPPYIAIEVKLDYSYYAPEGFGTGDNIVIGGKVLYVNDFKYGKGVPVSAEMNPQMLLYALGAYRRYLIAYQIDRVKLTIIQPRLDNISEFEIGINDLLVWGESIKPIAEKAFRGEGEFNPGEWCRFCRAKALCRARSEFSMAVINENVGNLPPILTNEEVGELLTKLESLGVEKWITALNDYGLSQCLAGNAIPGWKAVNGRGKRAYTNVTEAFKKLVEAGYAEALLYDREPKSPTEVEKLIGKKDYKALLSGYINTPPGKPALVPESDHRQAISNRTSAAEDFGIPIFDPFKAQDPESTGLAGQEG